jgi:uncharacterized protein YcfJ
MRTLLLVGIAAVAAISADAAKANHDGGQHSERRVIVVSGASSGDEAVYRSGDDRVLAESDYRGRWQGEWSGSWEDAEGRRYNGTYEGAYDAGRGARYDAPPPEADRRDDRRYRREERREIRRDYSDADLARLCRRDDGVGGAAIGAVVGGVAGNRIAGRGNRTEGTLLGAAGGAIAGAIIDRAEDGRCQDYWQRTDSRDGRHGDYRHDRYRHEDRRYDGYGYRGGYAYEAGSSYGYESGYYQDGGYYGGGVTTIVIPGAPIIIEETETTYETSTVVSTAQRARTAPRRVHRRAPAPRPRPRCVCR